LSMKVSDLIVSAGPHGHSGSRITAVSYSFLLALVPAAAMGVYYYGLDAVRVISASIASAMIAEALTQKILRKPITIADGSAAVSGFLLGLMFPASIPLYVVIVANFAGIIVGKLCFGGLGAGPVNPALVGWAVIRVTKTWAGFLDFDLMLINYHPGFTLQYPLAVLKAKGPQALSDFGLWSLFLGRQTGGIGAAATICLLLGGLYVVIRGAVRWEIPLCFLLGIALVSGIFKLANENAYAGPLFHMFTGNVMLGAFFLSTDNSSAPVNRWGMVVYGLGCGAMTIIFRVWSVYPDGVVFACLFMSLFVPILDKLKAKQKFPPVTRPTEFPPLSEPGGERTVS
jgi:electron transport complex protein RnfD